MPDSSFSQLHGSIKAIALNAMESGKPSGIFYGTVMSVEPLKIQLEQKMILESDFLVLSSLVRDFEVEMSVDSMTEDTAGGSGEAAFASHNHAYVGTKVFTVHLGLSVGEKVLLLRVQGGQQFVVLDRVVH